MTRPLPFRHFLTLCVAVNLAATPLRAQAATPAPTGNVLLATFPADASSKFELVIAPCTEPSSCPILVRLLRGGKVVDSTPLHWPAGDRNAASAATPLSAGDGVGDPVASAGSSKTSWVNGEEAFATATAASSILLSAGHSALLITQSGGWEHKMYHHDLFLAEGSKLRSVWTTQVTHGVSWSSVEISRGKEGADRIVYFTAFWNDYREQVDTVDVSLISWNPAKHQMVETRLEGAGNNSPPKAHLFIWGSYPTIAEAREAEGKAAHCLDLPTWVVDGESYGLAKAKFALVTPSLFSAPPTALKSTLRSCDPPMSVSVIPLNIRNRSGSLP